MDKHLLFGKLTELGLNRKQTYNDAAFARNIGLLTREQQDVLSDKRIGIPGLGGVGGSHLITLARTGIGNFHISDFDTFDVANINRQFGASVGYFGESKLETMKELALSINPFIKVKEFKEGITTDNIDSFIDGVDIIVDSLDFFEFEMRRLLFNRAMEKGVYVITAGPLGFSSAVLVFSPHKGLKFDEFFRITDGMDELEKLVAFSVGLAPRATHRKYMDFSKVDIQSKNGPSSYIACQICSAMAATEILRIFFNEEKVKPVPFYTQFDPFTRKFKTGRLFMGERNTLQYLKIKFGKEIIKKKINF